MPAATLLRFDPEEVVNVAAVPHLSPFRYPGGKTWLVPMIFRWLKSLNPRPSELAEPFAGGAIVSLSALANGFVKKIILGEKDPDVAAVWNVIVYGEGLRLGNEILAFDPTHDSLRALSREPRDEHQRAFNTVVRNRVQHGGILAAGASLPNQGENGRGIRSRWYPHTIRKRIQAIVQRQDDISFIQGDGIEFIRYNAHRRDTAFFIDPPYPGSGHRLYTYSTLDHRKLFQVAQTIRGHFLMTYNNNAEILELAKEFGFHTALIPMKNTHHKQMNELLVGRDLSWMRRT